MKLFVIRHGQTDYNAEKRFQGQANIPLNDVGRTQARRSGLVLGQLLASEPRKLTHLKIVSSDLLRTQQTSEIVCAELSGAHPELQTIIDLDERLREFHCGLFENSTYEEFVLNNPEVASEYMRRFDQDTYATRYPGEGGESRIDVMTRVGQALLDIQSDRLTEQVVWVVHGGVIDVLLELTHIQASTLKSERISAGNGDVLVLRHTDCGEPISNYSLNLGHHQVWKIERHYKIGDTIAAKVIR